jgi:hypothetical protein
MAGRHLRHEQCVRKCDSDLKILECGIGITALLDDLPISPRDLRLCVA